jgi:endonuclease/exonuclease/phosphatase family metal-dependent hydrolase
LRRRSQETNLRAVPPETIRIMTWNLFHGRDGLPGLGATRRSTWLRRPEEDGAHVHLNRKLTGHMAARIRAWAPDVCAVQEVSRRGLREVAHATGMAAVWTATGPLIGPAWLRDALAERNPDLWRTHESNVNALLVAPRLALVPGSRASVRLNPPRAILRDARDLRLTRGELARWIPEPRRLVLARVRMAGGAELVAGSVHCHNAREPEVTGREIARAAAAVRDAAGDRPAVMAGDLNAPPSHPALAALAADGWDGAAPGRGIGIDRIVHRGLETVEAPHRLDAGAREVAVSWAGRTRRLRLSDHDPVVAVLRAI